jgi:hypothetical protein
LKIIHNYVTEIIGRLETAIRESNANNTSLDIKLILQLKYTIYLCTSLISYNRRVILEKDFLSKQLDVDLNNVTMSPEINNTDETLYSEILISIFRVMDIYINYIKTELFTNSLLLLDDSILYFLKTFSKTFLSRKLNKDYYGIFKYITERLNNSTDESIIINFIITFIVDIWSSKSIKRDIFKVNKKLCDIFEILLENSYMSYTEHHQKATFLGRLVLSEKSFKDIIALHAIVITLNPIGEGKLRQLFYHGLTKIMLLESHDDRHTMLNELLSFYLDKLNTPVEYVDINNYIGYLKDFTGIISAVTNSNEYNIIITSLEFTLYHIDKMIRAYFNNSVFIKTVLKFYTELTFNRLNRFGNIKRSK